MGFGARVRAKRKASGLTLERLSERSRITPNYLGRIENEKVDPSLSVVLALAQALKASVGELVDAQPAPDARKRKSRPQSVSADALEIAAIYDRLPLDVRETVAPALQAIARRLPASSNEKTRRTSR
jgi:transcriptional regulator with XRE-family HTH domain